MANTEGKTGIKKPEAHCSGLGRSYETTKLRHIFRMFCGSVKWFQFFLTCQYYSIEFQYPPMLGALVF